MVRGLDLILRLDYATGTLKGGECQMWKRGDGQEGEKPILLMWAPGYCHTGRRKTDSACGPRLERVMEN